MAPLVFLLPFVLSAALYLSVVFSVISALPIAYVYLRNGRPVGLLASITNIALVWLLMGQFNAMVFFLIAIVLGASLSEAVRLRFSPENAVAWTLGFVLLGMVTFLAAYSLRYQVNPFVKIEALISQVVDKVVLDIESYKATNQPTSKELEQILLDPQMTKKNIFRELFSTVSISLLLLVVANLLLFYRLNLSGVRARLGLRKDFFKRWKAPYQLVWPTLFAGFCLVVEVPFLSAVAINFFKFFMAIYALQGMAIISAIFDSWRMSNTLRPLGYVLAIALLLPLVISLGFFDLWFDFRNKFKKENNKKGSQS